MASILKRSNVTLESVSRDWENVVLLHMSAGESIDTLGGAYTAPTDVLLLGDILPNNKFDIRQSVPYDQFYSLECYQQVARPNDMLRKVCEDRGAEKLYVSGGLFPLTQPDEVAVPAFRRSGTNWYLMPFSVFTEIGIGELVTGPYLGWRE